MCVIPELHDGVVIVIMPDSVFPIEVFPRNEFPTYAVAIFVFLKYVADLVYLVQVHSGQHTLQRYIHSLPLLYQVV